MNYLKANYENVFKYFLVLKELILNLFLKENFFKFVKFTFLHMCTGCSVYNLMKYPSSNNTVLLKLG